ncbi:MAG: RtcB family protein [Actinomycetota bacterium]|nr:RtcB family protein [Actinomycetota bacterium]
MHRKGATRAFPGQAVFIPGSMGTSSFVLAGEEGRWSRPSAPSATAPGGRCRAPAHASASAAPTCAASSRNRAITVRSPSNKGLAEEAPFAYKDVEAVVDVVTRAGLASPVAQLRPIGVVKG